MLIGFGSNTTTRDDGIRFGLRRYDVGTAFSTAVNVVKFESQLAALFVAADELRDPNETWVITYYGLVHGAFS
jgi:hypothetical protein